MEALVAVLSHCQQLPLAWFECVSGAALHRAAPCEWLRLNPTVAARLLRNLGVADAKLQEVRAQVVRRCVGGSVVVNQWTRIKP